ncbi:MAG: 4-hydroxythreonine-4-phosphate dehydrogenase PdxA [Acidobacteria bacterium]|nr:4-hydroxythreonine-4-phosphate dehydrogenase PdxA [Acidobacteriota bacterium]
MVRPRVAITVGDPSGIGPEIADKAARDSRVLEACQPVLFAPPAEGFELGVVSAAAGRAAYETIVKAVHAARTGEVDAIATAPVNKLAFARAGLRWKGHTDLLAHLCGVDHVVMLFHAPRLKVALVTVHVPLAEVSRLVTKEAVESTIMIVADALPRFGVRAPRLALAGLNPHAGEGGVLGSEDDEALAPAVAAARANGVDVSGPIPADTVFVRASRGEFDAVVACYHDQGLIPVKLLAFGESVNVTLGLPIVRTSVDHGTAFDIAGKGVANAGSLIEAVLLAAQLARTDPRAAA